MSQLAQSIPSLQLERYPQESSQLQAWEAADEYLLQHLDITQLDGRPVLLFNDAFGALACALHAAQPYSISDSWMSQRATWHNLQLNHLDPAAVRLLDSLAPLPAAPALVVIKIPKTLALLEQQLQALRQVVQADTVVIAAARARDIHTSTLQLFERILGPTRTSLAWRKARLIHCQVGELEVSDYSPTVNWLLDDHQTLIHNHANVFSRTSLDIGARLFMQHLPQDLTGEIADLGCGNGVIGLTALALNPQARLLFTDESFMALASSRLNVEHNRPQDLVRSEFLVSHGLEGIARERFQAVLCNPPFHQHHTLSDQIAWQMFCDAKRCLQTGGELRIVGNRHLDYYHKLQRLFGNCTTLAANQKFVVLQAIKGGARR